jgi:DNA-binding XRE family transcriptional regulator
MLVAVKTPLINLKARGRIPPNVLDCLKKEYGARHVKVTTEPDDELVDITTTDWYKEIKAKTTPGDGVRIYRENHSMTQAKLGEIIGQSAAYVSDLEHNRRAVSKKMAKQLAKLFSTSVERFI